jgi:hypothetical protein
MNTAGGKTEQLEGTRDVTTRDLIKKERRHTNRLFGTNNLKEGAM